MKMRRGWYLRWSNDHTNTEWLATCPVYLKSMQKSAEWRDQKLIITQIRVLRPARSFCIECQTTHS